MDRQSGINVKKHLSNLFRARFPIIYIPTWEESRAIEILSDIANDVQLIKTQRTLYIWSQTQGLCSYTTGKAIADTKTPVKALEYIADCSEAAIFCLKDFHVYFGADNSKADYGVIRKVRDSVEELKNSRYPKNMVFISPNIVLPNDLQKEVTIVEFGLPTLEEVSETLSEMIEANQEKIDILLSEREKIQMCKAALGLTLQEVENALARAMVEKGRLSIDELSIILDEKNQVIKKTGMLEFVKSDLSIDDVGGLENLKRWLLKRNKSWSDTASKYNLPLPKGVLITGVPGCGKSLTAKAISAVWKLPLLRLDMGKIFSGIVGSTEENMRKAIQTAEAVAPSILWIDEIEKGFSGVSGSSGDGGISSRIFGTFLTGMQDKTKAVFVVATANNISNLPSEMLRKGRFDEIFFVDLPTEKERKDIFQLHLKKRLTNSEISGNVDINDGLLTELSGRTEGFAGAEIEQIVVAALFEAFSEDRALEIKDLFKVISNMVPLSVTQSEQIMQIRNWANVRAVAATAREDRHEYERKEKENIQDPKITEQEDEVKKNRGGRSVDF